MYLDVIVLDPFSLSVGQPVLSNSVEVVSNSVQINLNTFT